MRTYMNKISANIKENNVIDLDFSIKDNIYNLCEYKIRNQKILLLVFWIDQDIKKLLKN